MALGFGANDRQLAPIGIFGGVFWRYLKLLAPRIDANVVVASKGATIFLGLAPIFAIWRQFDFTKKSFF